MTIRLAAIQIAVLMVICLPGCGNREHAAPASDSPAETVKQIADPENPDVPQPINAWGEFKGDDILLHWLDGAEGDYNVDGKVDGKDVFPLALRFNKPTDYSDSQQAEQPLDNCIDGNRDGTLDGLDLFTIAVHFNEEVRGYRIYDSLDGAEAAELTTTEIDRESGVGLCRPEHEWTATGKALEDGLHVFYLTAVAEYKQTSADEGTAVTLDVRNDPGFPQGAIWPARYHDRRNSYRSQFRGPREYDPETVEYFPWSNLTAYSSKYVVGSSSQAILGYYTLEDWEIDFELGGFDMAQGEYNWDSGPTTARFGAYSLNMLDSGDVLALSKTDKNSYVFYKYSADGTLLETITLPEELGVQSISSIGATVTADQGIFLKYKAEDIWYHALWTLSGDESWRVPFHEPYTTDEKPLLALSNGTVVIGDQGKLIALRESDGGEQWSYPIQSDMEGVYGMELGLSADTEDNIYFGYGWLEEDDSHQHAMFGVIDSEGNEISNSGPFLGRMDHFVTLDDGTALMIYKESGGFTGYTKRLYADTLEPLWEDSGNLYDLLAIDSERYMYVRSASSTMLCLSPEGKTVFSSPNCFTAFIGSNGDLYATTVDLSSLIRIPGLSHVVN